MVVVKFPVSGRTFEVQRGLSYFLGGLGFARSFGGGWLEKVSILPILYIVYMIYSL